MRLKTTVGAACRIALIACLALAVWRSTRLAMADWAASAGTIEGLQRAKRYAPDDPRLLARLAIAKNDAGDESAEVEQELRRASELNPFDSRVLMALGLREEFRGERAKAENDLVRATEVDSQFRPAWTLANFYERTGQADKSWPMIERILNLNPLGYDPAPVFELCWRVANGDARRIQSLIPKTGHRPVEYLAFLMNTQRLDAALEAWPTALRTADLGSGRDAGTLTDSVIVLINADRNAEAVLAWNDLVERGVIRSGKLEPAKGVSIADPDFRYPLTGGGFQWNLAEVAGAPAYAGTGGVRFELNGDEPESFQMLSTWAPLVPDQHYRLTWKTDASMLNAPKDPGFRFRIIEEPGNATTECGPLLTGESCDFTSPEAGGIRKARIELNYMRAQGTTRPSGTLRLNQVRLEFAQ